MVCRGQGRCPWQVGFVRRWLTTQEFAWKGHPVVVLIRLVAGILLIAHGLVHLLYLVPDVKEFRLEDSWLVPEAVSRPIAISLITATITASVLLGLAIWGVPLLAGLWPLIAVVAAVTSLALLFSFWDTRLIFGVALDITLIALVVMRPEWTQRISG